jgi:hypothetical protein
MTHIFIASSLNVTGNPDTHPSEYELHMPDGTKSIAELIYEAENQGKDDSRQSDGKTFS